MVQAILSGGVYGGGGRDSRREPNLNLIVSPGIVTAYFFPAYFHSEERFSATIAHG